MSLGRGQLVRLQGEVECLRSELSLASSTLDSRDVVVRELNETIRRASEVKEHTDRKLRRFQGIVHRGGLENTVLSDRVKDLEHNISLGTSHHHDVLGGINKLHKALMHLVTMVTRSPIISI